VAACEQNGAYAYIQKPYDIVTLKGVLDRGLARRRAARSA
jgi:hypothetical protein